VADPVAVAVTVEVARAVDDQALPGPDVAADRHDLHQLDGRVPGVGQ
jgi:hypothetical protein